MYVNAMDAVREAIKQLTGSVRAQAETLLDELQPILRIFGARLPSASCIVGDDGSFTLEWRFSDRRLAFTLEVDPNESGWHFVSANGPMGVGSSAQRDLRHIFSTYVGLPPNNGPLPSGIVPGHTSSDF